MAEKKRNPGRNKPQGRTAPGTLTITQRWQAAKAAGVRMFDPGVACVNGHISLRWTNSGICAECKRARDNAYNAAHKEEHRARSRRSVIRRAAEVRQYQSAYYRANPEVAKRRASEWEKAHRPEVRKRHREWYAKNATRLRPIASARRAANPEPSRAAAREWKANNAHKVRAADALRRAREIGAQAGNRKAYAAYLKWARSAKSVPCYWCRTSTKPGKKSRHIDHITPLARGGADAVGNLCVSCPACNLTKNAKQPFEFAGQGELRLA